MITKLRCKCARCGNVGWSEFDVEPYDGSVTINGKRIGIPTRLSDV